MRFLLLAAALGVGLGAGQDPREIVRRSVLLDEGRNADLARWYSYLERVQAKRLKENGEVQSVSARTHEILMIDGTPHRRLLEREGKPISPEQQRQQEGALLRALESRRKETPAERAARQAEFEKRRSQYRKAIREIPDAFLFRLAGEEVIGSRPAFVIEATPRPGYKPVDRYSKLYTQLRGKLWIDKSDYHWAKLEAELLDTVTFGWILARIHKGSRVSFTQTCVNDEVWLPRRLWYVASVRVGLVKLYRVETEAAYSDYRRADSDPRLMPTP